MGPPKNYGNYCNYGEIKVHWPGSPQKTVLLTNAKPKFGEMKLWCKPMFTLLTAAPS